MGQGRVDRCPTETVTLTDVWRGAIERGSERLDTPTRSDSLRPGRVARVASLLPLTTSLTLSWTPNTTLLQLVQKENAAPGLPYRIHAPPRNFPAATDDTRHGEGRASPRSFLTHNFANMPTSPQFSTHLSPDRHPSRRGTPKPSSQRRERARACSAPRVGSCNMCLF